MALSDDQKQDIVFYLGYPGTVLIPTSTSYSKIVADRLDNLNSRIESQVASLLTQIADMRSKFTASTGRMLVKKVGDIELNCDNEFMLLNQEYYRLLRDLAALLDLALQTKGSGVNVGLIL